MKSFVTPLTAFLLLACTGTARAGWSVPAAASIALTKTVSTDGTCGSSNDITIPTDTEVTYCYEVKNTGDVTLKLHTLTDDVMGTLLGPNAAVVLLPDETGVVTATQTVNATVVNTALWVATGAAVDMWDGQADATTEEVASATAVATVTVLETGTSACSDGIDNNGNSLIDCADPSCSGERICTAGAPAMGSVGLIAVALALLALGSFALIRRQN